MQPGPTVSSAPSLRKRLHSAATATSRGRQALRSTRSLPPVVALGLAVLAILCFSRLRWAPTASNLAADQQQQQQQLLQEAHLMEEEEPLKAWNIVLLAPRCCDDSHYSEQAERECLAGVLAACHGLSPSECYTSATSTPSCAKLWQPRGYKISYAAAIRRAVPYMRRLGWKNFRVYRDLSDNDLSLKGVPEDSQMREGACNVVALREATEAALRRADIIMTESGNFKFLFPVYPTARFIILDTSDTATLRVKLTREHGSLDDPRIMAVFKPQVLLPAALNNQEIFEYTSHLAWLPGAAAQPQFMARREPQASARVLDRTVALLSHVYRYRYPFDCGGRLEHMRFAGFFAQNFTAWRPPPLRSRSIDLAFFGKVDSGLYSKPEKAVLAAHRKAALAALTSLQAAHPELTVLPGDKFFPQYADYVAALQDVKALRRPCGQMVTDGRVFSQIFVSPYGAGEWSHKDFEAMMCGCLVLKPRAAFFTTYPAVFQPGLTCVTTDVAWSDLEPVALDMLENLDRAQRIADKASMRLLEFSEMNRYAGDLDAVLTYLVQQDAAEFPDMYGNITATGDGAAMHETEQGSGATGAQRRSSSSGARKSQGMRHTVRTRQDPEGTAKDPG